MSGGRFNYMDSTLKIEIFGWANRPTNVFEDREISELVWDVFDLIHSYDWYASGDTCKETYLKDKADFKKKWFSNRGVRTRAIVDGALSDVRRELYETFGVSTEPGDGQEIPDKPLSNGDMFRKMTDEQLAHHVSLTFANGCIEDNFREWLKLPANEETWKNFKEEILKNE